MSKGTTRLAPATMPSRCRTYGVPNGTGLPGRHGGQQGCDNRGRTGQRRRGPSGWGRGWFLVGVEQRGQTLAGVGEVPSDDVLDRVDLLGYLVRVVVFEVMRQVGVDVGGRVRVDGRPQTEAGQ